MGSPRLKWAGRGSTAPLLLVLQTERDFWNYDLKHRDAAISNKNLIYNCKRFLFLKINKTSGIVEASRILNLYQFVQLYKDITSQAAGVLAQSGTSEEAAEGLTSVSSSQASLWMGRLKQPTDEDECCICMDGRVDLILPCAHSFCQKCIDKWSDRHRSCPVCRRQVTGAGDSWVVSDAPTEDDIATYILNMVDEVGQPLRP
ncbi:hypothetical protein CIB84_009179 [Bambusicola thoracicus]|uniref:RING finger protein 141 n=1 Tax=Bambusicola thoracicus TaxID=9083 RepID=A0A2P4SSI3_BAMTH|nr:hypothetical protein CIB84_009179 [Bambusicola thoracicus]